MIRAALILLLLGAPALAHDTWISRGGHRNQAGEFCCGAGDCFIVPSEDVSQHADGYHIKRRVAGGGVFEVEIVPLAEAQPSPDGAYWRCKRPDGSRRCFFSPPPNT